MVACRQAGVIHLAELATPVLPKLCKVGLRFLDRPGWHRGQSSMDNPLLSTSLLADFSAIEARHIGPAISELLATANLALEQAASAIDTPGFDEMSRLLDVPLEHLQHAWGLVGHLNAVADNPEIRAAFNENLPQVMEFMTRMSSDERLYARYKAMFANDRSLSPTRTRILELALRDFVLGGAELQGEAKQRFAEIQARLAQLSQSFSEHVLDATDSFALYVDEADVAGLPADTLTATRYAAEQEGKTGCKLSLHMPVYLPVMQYVVKRDLREAMHRAFVTRASELGSNEHDNTAIIAEILGLRQEQAVLLGYRNPGELSLASKMADSPDAVLAFLRDLASRSRVAATKDFADLQAFAAAELSLPALEAWDMAFASEKLKEARYAFNAQEVKQYFPEARVLDGLFGIVEKLYGVKILPDTAPVWHPNVRFFRLEHNGSLIGQFYLDLYARPGKRPGAWMGSTRSRWQRPAGSTQTPVAYLVCNFTPPHNGQPVLLTHQEITTLFHETGHGLHHLLTRVDDLGASGISGVEWDAVELPSQFMENFCYEWSVLQSMSAHVQTGEPLPRSLFNKMLAAKNFQSGLAMLRQVEFAMTDMLLHTQTDADNHFTDILYAVRQEVAVVAYPTWNRMLHSFSHIFAGGYAAGYYSYKWSEVLSADCWDAFPQDEPVSAVLGQRFLEEILSVGGSRNAMDNFVAFRGRKPTIDALLRQSGLSLAL